MLFRSKKSLAEGGKAGVQLLRLGGQRRPRIVKAYKHLGVLTAAGPGFDREIVARTNAANGVTFALSRGILSDSRIPGQHRARVAQACSHSTLLHAAGTWGSLTAGQLKRLQTAWMKPLRKAADAHRPPPEGQHWASNEAIKIGRAHV